MVDVLIIWWLFVGVGVVCGVECVVEVEGDKVELDSGLGLGGVGMM